MCEFYMKDLVNWMNLKIRKYDWIDIKLIKLATFLVALPVAAYFPSNILPYWWVFLVAALIVAIKPYYKLFT